MRSYAHREGRCLPQHDPARGQRCHPRARVARRRGRQLHVRQLPVHRPYRVREPRQAPAGGRGGAEHRDAERRADDAEHLRGRGHGADAPVLRPDAPVLPRGPAGRHAGQDRELGPRGGSSPQGYVGWHWREHDLRKHAPQRRHDGDLASHRRLRCRHRGRDGRRRRQGAPAAHAHEPVPDHADAQRLLQQRLLPGRRLARHPHDPGGLAARDHGEGEPGPLHGQGGDPLPPPPARGRRHDVLRVGHRHRGDDLARRRERGWHVLPRLVRRPPGRHDVDDDRDDDDSRPRSGGLRRQPRPCAWRARRGGAPCPGVCGDLGCPGVTSSNLGPEVWPPRRRGLIALSLRCSSRHRPWGWAQEEPYLGPLK
mmetsp:Transcript_23039/g.58805  ORF Transcript_23039/g.58805 Transcript_23039/m.58805 type:complete len:368 (-) Transcript_23039:3-1106(-)